MRPSTGSTLARLLTSIEARPSCADCVHATGAVSCLSSVSAVPVEDSPELTEEYLSNTLPVREVMPELIEAAERLRKRRKKRG